MGDGGWAFEPRCRSATLATVAPDGRPRLVPICFVLVEAGESGGIQLYSPLDEKPKRAGDLRRLARVRDILERPRVALLFERWSEDWSQLAWLRAHGTASLLEPSDEPAVHRSVVAALREKYPQYRSQLIDSAPLIRVEIDDTTAWSATDASPLEPPMR